MSYFWGQMSNNKYKSEAVQSQVNEAFASYAQSLMPGYQSSIKRDRVNYGGLFENKMVVIQAIASGLPYQLFELIQGTTPFTDDEWADYLNLSKKTLQRNKLEKGFRFKPIHSEKILELAEVNHFGSEVFDSLPQLHQWLQAPSVALAGYTPAALLRNSYGKELVMAELNRIEHGIFA